MIRRGEVYLARLDRRTDRLGKTRPVMILQSDLINQNLAASPYQDIIVLPLTTRANPSPLCLRIPRRDRLEHESTLNLTTPITIHLNQLDRQSGPLTTLSARELTEVQKRLRVILGFGDGEIF